jgi:AcrR family transcriptional regulator
MRHNVSVVGAANRQNDVTCGIPPAQGHKVLRHLGADDRSSTRVRIVDATLACLARQGLGKTTVDDIARQATFSRATVYRTFPGGKDAIVEAVVDTEVARLFSSLAVVMGEATDLEEVLVAGMVEAAQRLSAHSALAYLLLYEPGVVLPRLTFSDMDRILLKAGDFAAPFFARWLSPDQASRAAEWAVRIVLAYLADPAPGTDLTDPGDTRSLVRTFVMPGILALRAASGTDAPGAAAPSTPSTSSLNSTKGATP